MTTTWTFRITLTLLTALALAAVGATGARAQDTFTVETVMVPMADGTKLATDVYLPAGDGPWPVVMMRTPYDISSRGWFGEGLAHRGFAVVLQDVRGQGRSEGRFVPFAFERADGRDTADWISEQSWSNGRIGLWGASYNGYAAFELAMTGHPAVASIFHISGYSDLARFLSRGGAFQLQAHLFWYYSYASGQPAPPDEAWPQIFRTVPLGDFFRGAEGVWDLAAAPYDHADITVPVMHVTGWYDYIYPNTLETYNDLAVAAPEREQRLVIGPWSHNGVLANWTKVGNVEFGPEAAAGIEWSLDLTAGWFRHSMEGETNDLSRAEPVRYFVMGDNRWIDDATWPPSNADFQAWYVHGDGVLSREAPRARSQGSSAAATSFVYDPLDPVPTLGGANSHFFPDNLGPKDQGALADRDDVLTFTSEPLTADATLAGPIRAIVYASTTGPDTDFTAKLSVVRPDGFVRNIEDGIVRARHLFAGTDSTGYVTPGAVYRYEIACGASALALNAGERLRLQISSSSFPEYDRNPNTGIDPLYATEFVPATQTVFHTADYPTHVVVPVLRTE